MRSIRLEAFTVIFIDFVWTGENHRVDAILHSVLRETRTDKFENVFE